MAKETSKPQTPVNPETVFPKVHPSFAGQSGFPGQGKFPSQGDAAGQNDFPGQGKFPTQPTRISPAGQELPHQDIPSIPLDDENNPNEWTPPAEQRPAAQAEQRIVPNAEQRFNPPVVPKPMPEINPAPSPTQPKQSGFDRPDQPSLAPTAKQPERTGAKPGRKPNAFKQPPSQFIFRLLRKNSAPVYVEGQGYIEDSKRTGRQPRLFLKTEDVIEWPYVVVNGKNVPLPFDDNLEDLKQDGVRWLPRTIRYAYGLNTPFLDEQVSDGGEALKRENGRNSILDNPANRDAMQFVGAEMRVPGTDFVRYSYLTLTNQCKNQHPKARRYGSVSPEFELIDFAGEDGVKVKRGILRARMYELASTAREDEMMPHAKFLGISMVIPLTGQDREPDAIREDYRDKALADPELFEKTFSDPKVKVTYWIQELVASGDISINNLIAGQAHWARTGKFISMLPPEKNPIEFLSEFALLREGEEFAQQIRAVRLTR